MIIISKHLIQEYVERSPSDDAGIEINKACILYKVILNKFQNFQ
jgi:hypothetical protein